MFVGIRLHLAQLPFACVCAFARAYVASENQELLSGVARYRVTKSIDISVNTSYYFTTLPLFLVWKAK